MRSHEHARSGSLQLMKEILPAYPIACCTSQRSNHSTTRHEHLTKHFTARQSWTHCVPGFSSDLAGRLETLPIQAHESPKYRSDSAAVLAMLHREKATTL